MDTLKFIKAERNSKVAAKTPVLVTQDGGEHGGRHMLWTPAPQDGRPHVMQEPPAQGGRAFKVNYNSYPKC